MSLKYFFKLIVVSNIIITNCVAQKINTIESVKYDDTKNVTIYSVFPFGNVSINGEWAKTHFNSSSGQQFFINKDSVEIAISLNSYKNFEFNLHHPKSGFDFVKNYYDWDSKYFVDNSQLKREIIKQDSVNNYIIWRLFGENNGVYVDNLFLFGITNKTSKNFMIKTNKMDIDSKTNFLTNIYLNK